jgi:large subunit ribosomal protein L32e
MSKIEELLEVRRELKERKPAFIRQDHQRRKRIGRKLRWKKPRGIHSKIRHHLKGRRKMPSPGYKSPSKVRGLHASGMKIVNVSSAKEINNIKKDTEGIVISKQVGIKKRFEILKRAKELGIAALNINIDEHLKKIEDFINSKKKRKKETKDSKEKPEAKEKEHKPAELTEEQKKEMQKKEKDKLLTKKV